MRRILVIGANILWFLSTLISSRRWNRATRNVAQVQKKVLLDIVRRNRSTAFGKEHGFGTVTTVEKYRDSVTPKPYEGFEPSIARIADGEIGVLTEEPVKLFEPSSGTSGGKKLIPYTGSLQKEFQAGIDPWINRLYRGHPGMFFGKAYWSIAPVADMDFTKGGLPVGFATDSEYLGSLQRSVVETVMAVPKEVSLLRDVEAFRYVTALFLLATRDLALISVWHPSFLTLLFEVMELNVERLVRDVANGTIADDRVTNESRVILEKKLRPDAKRADEIGRVFLSRKGKIGTWKNDRGKTLYEELWPKLRVVSCWGDAQAGHFFDRLRTYFPSTYCEPKGLIATEGFISFPVGEECGSALSLRSHFFEFREVVGSDTAERILLAHELRKGRKYEVLLTTSGGFYRYDLGDIVEVSGFQAQCPVMRFVGKESSFVDVCGEKLSESEVTEVARRVFMKYGVAVDFWMLAPEVTDADTIGYTLFLKDRSGPGIPEDTARIIGGEIDIGLGHNFHYSLCRKLDQLQRIRVFMIRSGSDPAGQYLDRCHREGQRLGNIKPRVLHPGWDWGKVFLGTYV
ncbi:MAG: GH3 auxin-responsive promoter family protein [Candidatus Moranbacteria bacterium]|nr:GH3 auxin-responsive promoter family protein [Candidatus Moranbacteria bacterium]